jgi:hypothetical protein
MEIGKQGRKEGREAIDKTGFSAREVLLSPEFEGIGEVNAKDGKKEDGKGLSSIDFKAAAFEEKQKTKEEDAGK